MQEFDKKNPQTSFGAFKPVGNIVIVMDDEPSAIILTNALLQIGLEKSAVTQMDGIEFVAVLDKLVGEESVLAALGSELRKTDVFRKHAKKGASFVVAFAPSDDETKAVMAEVEKHRYRFALKYGHMIIETFDPEHPASSQ